MRGKLIVFEGSEGGGKTTQMQRCRLWLHESGILHRTQKTSGSSPRILVTAEPGGTELGQGLRRLLLEQNQQETIRDRAELFLYAADRAQHIEDFIKPELARGSIILCDRFTDSTIAYQGYGRGISLPLIQQINQIATDGVKSDLTLWLDVDVELGLRRARNRSTPDRMEAADLAFHQRVRQGFTALAKADPDRMVRVDASGSEEEVAVKIQAILWEKFTHWFPG